jgi:hypothetical protein
MQFLPKNAVRAAVTAARVMLNDAQTRTLHQFKTTVWIVRRR